MQLFRLTIQLQISMLGSLLCNYLQDYSIQVSRKSDSTVSQEWALKFGYMQALKRPCTLQEMCCSDNSAIVSAMDCGAHSLINTLYKSIFVISSFLQKPDSVTQMTYIWESVDIVRCTCDPLLIPILGRTSSKVKQAVLYIVVDASENLKTWNQPGLWITTLWWYISRFNWLFLLTHRLPEQQHWPQW